MSFICKDSKVVDFDLQRIHKCTKVRRGKSQIIYVIKTVIILVWNFSPKVMAFTCLSSRPNNSIAKPKSLQEQY